jgi:integrase
MSTRATATPLTVGEAYAALAEQQMRAGTWGPNYDRQNRRWLAPLLVRPFRDLTPSEIDRWHKSIPPKTMANRCLIVLRRLCRQAVHDRVPGLRFNPCEGVRANRTHIRKRIIHLGEEMTRLLDVLKDIPLADRAFIELCMGIAARHSEIRGLQWDHLDLTTGHVLTWQRKTKRDKRLAIPPTPLALLRDLADQRLCRCPWVFCQAHHGPWSQTDLHRAWDKIRRAAKLEQVTIHDLRRSRLSHIYAQTRDIKQAQQLAGHSNVVNTWRYIVVDVTDDVNRANAELDALIRNGHGAQQEVTP